MQIGRLFGYFSPVFGAVSWLKINLAILNVSDVILIWNIQDSWYVMICLLCRKKHDEDDVTAVDADRAGCIHPVIRGSQMLPMSILLSTDICHMWRRRSLRLPDRCKWSKWICDLRFTHRREHTDRQRPLRDYGNIIQAASTVAIRLRWSVSVNAILITVTYTLLRHYMPRPLPSYWIRRLSTRRKMNMLIFRRSRVETESQSNRNCNSRFSYVRVWRNTVSVPMERFLTRVMDSSASKLQLGTVSENSWCRTTEY